MQAEWLDHQGSVQFSSFNTATYVTYSCCLEEWCIYVPVEMAFTVIMKKFDKLQ